MKRQSEGSKDASESSSQSVDDEESREDMDPLAVLGMQLTAIGSVMWDATAVMLKIWEAIDEVTGTIIHTVWDAIQCLV